MALEDQAAQPQQGRTVVAARVDALFQRAQHGHGRQRGQLGEQVARELFAQKARNHAGQPFGGFQRHVAHEAIAHHDVGGALEGVVALHVAVKVDHAGLRGPPQQLASTLDFFAALDGFFADVEQAHERVGLAAQG